MSRIALVTSAALVLTFSGLAIGQMVTARFGYPVCETRAATPSAASGATESHADGPARGRSELAAIDEVLRELRAQADVQRAEIEATREAVDQLRSEVLSATPRLAAAEALETGFQRESASRASEVVDRATSQGRWTERDTDQLQAELPHMSARDREALLARLIPRINRGEIWVEDDLLSLF